MTNRRIALAAAAALALALVPALPAAAAVEEAAGEVTTPEQPYLANPNTGDWLGGYVVGDEVGYPVEFALAAPDTDEPVGGPEALLTKFDAALPDGAGPSISYLLWRYGQTTDDAEAAALAHLLHVWTASPTNPAQLDASNDFRHIAYDAPYHFARLSAPAVALVDSMATEAAALAGIWATEFIPPTEPQVGVPGQWTLRISTDAGDLPVPGVPVHLEAIGGAFAGDLATLDLVTDADGEVTFVLVPSADSTGVDEVHEAPASSPLARPTVDADTTDLVFRADNVVSVGSGREVSAAPAAPEPTAPELPATGADPMPAMILLAGVLALGVVAIAVGRRGRGSAPAPGIR